MNKVEPNQWMVRAGEGSLLIDVFLKQGIVALGWNELGKLQSKMKHHELKALFQKTYPDNSPGRISQSVGQLWRFFSEFKVGDWVITYDSNIRRYFIGVITSEYEYNEDLEYCHYRKVDWGVIGVDRDDLSTKTKNLLGSILTIFVIPDDYWAEILGVSNGLVLESDLEEIYEMQEQYEAQELEDLKKDIVSRSNEFMKDIISKLSWDDTERLVAGLMETMGYKTRLTGPGGDLGVDIIASPDGLGMLEPRIKVEVKNKEKNKVGAPDLRNFIGGMRGKDKGIYVSTTGFSKEARYEAERANFVITLIDSNLLVELITENYEELKPEYKALMPLRKIYWPI